MSNNDTTNLQKLNQNTSQSYKFPEYRSKDFHCPHCHVYAKQNWYNICRDDIDNFIESFRIYLREKYYNSMLNSYGIIIISNTISNLWKGRLQIDKFWTGSFIIPSTEIVFCDHCKKFSIWIDKEMIYPLSSVAPLPIGEMPLSVKRLYNEARDIFNKSPRGACALLRLAIQVLVKELGEDEKNLNQAIGNLVERGLPEDIQKALDILRVIGNKAVHPGKISKEDDSQTVKTLFILVNLICEKMITDKNKLKSMYDSLSKNQKEAIDKRDSKTKKQVKK